MSKDWVLGIEDWALGMEKRQGRQGRGLFNNSPLSPLSPIPRLAKLPFFARLLLFALVGRLSVALDYRYKV